MRETQLLIIRHAESVWNASDRWQGHGDPPLSDRGRRQAEALAEELADERVDVLVSSDLRRALETARIVGARWDLEPRVERELRELDIGEWTGLTRSEIATRSGDALRRFEAEEPDVRPGGGESRREIRSRVRKAVAALVASDPARTIAIVTHLGVIRALFPGSEPKNGEWRRVPANQVAAAGADG